MQSAAALPALGGLDLMRCLASPIATLKAEYDVVVVGSGYGGAIAASRLARANAGCTVCVLERGRELRPGEYPDTLARVLGETQLDTPRRHLFSRTGLYDLRFNEDMSVFVGCGLGGTSLINAGVSLPPSDNIFKDDRWPKGLREDFDNGKLAEAFEWATEMLNPKCFPESPHVLRKRQALEKSAAYLNEKSKPTPINVAFDEMPQNHVGVEQHRCRLCGDCVSGCNYGAKSTLLMNYLPDAKAHGVEIYTEISVRRLQADRDGWVVHYEPLSSKRARFTSETMTLRAKIVVLAAGTLGSTEILLRSADPKLPQSEQLTLSNKVGYGFGGNGDTLGIGYQTDEPVNGVGAGRHRPDVREMVGPCISGMIDLRERDGPYGGLMIQEGSIPGALATVIPVVLGVAALVFGRFQGRRRAESIKDLLGRWLGLLRGPYRGAMRNTQTFLVMAQDNAEGRLYLEGDRVRVWWPGAAQQPIFERVNECLGAATSALRGTYIANPVPITTHPLGGCCMAEDAAHGVVNHEGQVFSGQHGKDVYENLYVCDGSIIPLPLGVNPLLTISALAERMCDRLAKRKKWNIDYALTPVQQAPPRPPESLRFTETAGPGLQFTEKMSGHFCLTRGASGPGVASGRMRHPIECTLTIISDDLERMLTDRPHAARLVGTVFAPQLSKLAMTVTNGEFDLFVLDPKRVETRLLRYRMSVTSNEGRAYRIEGFKRVRNSLPTRAWANLSILHIKILDANCQVIGKGLLRLSAADFIRQLSTIRARNVQRFTQRLDTTVRFVSAFGETLLSTYGRMLARATVSTPDAPPSKPSPPGGFECYTVRTLDTTRVHLTRFPASGRRRPIRAVILSPGFSVSAWSFAARTVETNLVDYLRVRGYDVWLLDYRASSDFTTAGAAFTIDDIALRDYPAAVEEVLCHTEGVKQVQIVAHCVGSMSFLMSLLSGKLQGKVRSAICSQLGVHPVPPKISVLKTALYTATLLRLVGVKAISADFDPYRLSHRVVDKLLTLYPTRERCNSPVCRRILFLLGESYLHRRLNTATHDAINEWFGVTNTTALAHLSRMVRKGWVVDSEGQDVYLRKPNVEQYLKLPITFMHGTRNREFLMEGTCNTYKLLREVNPSDPPWYKFIPIRGYGHMDCFIGRNAAHDVFPLIAEELENPPGPKGRS